jgi:hypothetical protein
MLWRDEWLNHVGNAGIADELVRQFAEAMLTDRISVADIRQALDRRFRDD